MITHLGIAVIVDPAVPLSRTLPDGTIEEVLCWRAPDGSILLHPDRRAAFQGAIDAVNAEAIAGIDVNPGSANAREGDG